jgi:hypothetical protein
MCLYGKKELIVGFQTSLSVEVRLRKLTPPVDREEHNSAWCEKMW